MTIEKVLSIALILHIAAGTIALISGLVAMLATKGNRIHRLAGKVYFGGMTTIFVTALVMAIGRQLDFLLMVAFFSYYMTVRGYRILSLKKLNQGQRFAYLDWIIAGVASVFILGLLAWGSWSFLHGNNMGLVAFTFGLIGFFFLVSDVKALFNPPKEKMHWWYGHISSMGGSYISAVTAFVVVNIQLTHYQWILWVLPALIGGALISQTIRKYKLKFSTP
ncbi:MAG: hypothetical protein IPJ20_04055 [Flammeovirgaceae bacterium]|nr:hypothetical protein [Flammeovirgaceae bacterium]